MIDLLTLKSPLFSMHLKDFWAKTSNDSSAFGLSVQDHSLVVGFIAKFLHEKLSASVAAMMPKGSVTLVAAHDVGKISPGFQLKDPKWKHYDDIAGKVFHDSLITNHALVSQGWLQFSEKHRLSRLANLWCVSSAGHHGSYPNGLNRLDDDNTVRDAGCHGFGTYRDELLTELINVFGPLPTESAKGEIERVHLLTGFTIFCDWLGSNTDWFPFETPIEEGTIRKIASDLLKKLGYEVKVREFLSFGELFELSPSGALMEPRGIQSVLLDAADAPGLYIVEAPMGMGKTEAALATAYKRWTEGPERGIYFALPTQLTSERIHERIHSFLNHAIETHSAQSLIHGNAWLSEARNRMIGARIDDLDANDTEEALRWFSSTRRQLLAPFGTGTIDQALLAVLPAKFAALRYFGLAGKVVVIDEVHSYDPYMSALIDRLIRYLLKSGSTVIILSATLTTKRRAELVEAAGAKEETVPCCYPLITKVSTGSPVAAHIPVPHALPAKPVKLVHQHLRPETCDAYWQNIADQIVAGANVVVIRNSVALAQETYRLLKSYILEAIPNESCGLLHSRFPQFVRNENEGKWVTKLGKDESQRPSGSFLVSTQIVEQSVDIDADLLVTDLAPADLILQRIGRLHRHERKNPRPSGFETPTCHILHPCGDWTQDARVVAQLLAPHHYIYPPFKLWQASEYFREKSCILIPNEIRAIIEESGALKPPHEASDALDDFIAMAHKDYTEQIRTAATRDVFLQSAITDREGAQTRYNLQPTAYLILLQRMPDENADTLNLKLLDGSELTANKFCFSYDLANALHSNAIRIPAYLVRATMKCQPDWLKNYMDDACFGIINGRKVELHGDEQSHYSLEYTAELGLTYFKNKQHLIQTEPEDFWY